MSEPLLYPGERLDDLQYRGLRVIQRPEAFRFSMDAVLLAAFASLRKRARVCDLGAGTGVLSLLMAAREDTARFDAVEIQPDIADMAARSVTLNGLDGRIAVHARDIRDALSFLPVGRYDLCVCNPPYFAQTGRMQSASATERLSRHEGDTPLAAFVSCAARLLRNGGRFACVFPAARALALCDEMRNARVEPKRLRFIYPDAKKAPHAVLCEGVLGARPGLHPEPPLIVQDERGEYTPEVRAMYHMDG